MPHVASVLVALLYLQAIGSSSILSLQMPIAQKQAYQHFTLCSGQLEMLLVLFYVA